MLLYVGVFFKWVSSETTPHSGKRGVSVKNFPGNFVSLNILIIFILK